MSQTEECLKKRILAVDDDIIVLTRISSILRNDYDLVTVNSGMRALKYLELEKPDLILLDVRMMQQDGIETLRKIRNMEECKDIPVIMLTGVESREIVVESAKLGVCDYLLKPFSSVELLKRVSRVFGQEEREDEEEES
ncbi:MAG: response regulator [Lachnospiraceae bacterium]|jgi:response regulator RpfG family c-di-GMP phosphodiesterase|nr:response regulator [Lachnospiraceae bacterium]MCI9589872.1 response regulator [Lachnospiraceae bacterium]